MKRNFGFVGLFLIMALVPVSAFSAGLDSASFTPPELIEPSGGGVPVGTIIAWPVAANPKDAAKWLECNGQAISQTVYPKLFALVGANVPDYRGIFLRGHGIQVSRHYGTVTHASAGLGQLQGDAIRNIKGRVVADPSRVGSSPTGPFYKDGEGWNNHTDTGSSGTIWFEASRATPTANEIRPVNMAVRYLIRAAD